MHRPLKRRLAIAVASLATLAGGTAAALGATGSTAPAAGGHARQGRQHARHGMIASASAYLGVSPARLREEVASGRTLGEIAAATPGHSESGLVAALVAAAKQRPVASEAQIAERVENIVSGRRALGRSERHAHLRLQAARAYLGITRKEMLKDLRSGQTLAQIADATPGRSAAGLRAALLAEPQAHLSAEVSSHRLSKSAEQRRLTRLEAKIAEVLGRAHPVQGRHPHRHG